MTFEPQRPARKRKYLIRKPRKRAAAGDGGSLDELAFRRYGRSRHELIAEAAYFRAQRRGFLGGDADQDWIDAEAEVAALLREVDHS